MTHRQTLQDIDRLRSRSRMLSVSQLVSFCVALLKQNDRMTEWPSDQVTKRQSDRKLCRRLTIWYILYTIYHIVVEIFLTYNSGETCCLTGVTNQDRKYTNYPIYSGSGADCLSTVNTLCHKYLWRSELWTPIQEWGRKQYPNME